MQQKTKICDKCQQQKFIWKNYEGKRYCLSCWNIVKPDKPIVVKKIKPIKQISDKRKTQNKEYKIIRDKFIKDYPYCQASIPYICTSLSTDVHHMAGRTGDNLNDTTKFLSVCRSCHNWIELNPQKAKEMGFSINRI